MKTWSVLIQMSLMFAGSSHHRRRLSEDTGLPSASARAGEIILGVVELLY